MIVGRESLILHTFDWNVVTAIFWSVSFGWIAKDKLQRVLERIISKRFVGDILKSRESGGQNWYSIPQKSSHQPGTSTENSKIDQKLHTVPTRADHRQAQSEWLDSRLFARAF